MSDTLNTTFETVSTNFSGSTKKKTPAPFRQSIVQKQAWWIWSISMLFFLYQFFLQLVSGEIVDGLMASFSITALGAGVLTSAYYYVYVALQIPVGILMDRFGPRYLLSIGAFVAGVGSFMFATSHSLGAAVLGRVLMGAGSTFSFIGLLHLLVKWFPANRFGVLSAFSQTVGMIGSMASGLYLAETVHQVGWRFCILIAAQMGILISLLLWLFIRDKPQKKANTHQEASTECLKMNSIWHDLSQLATNKIVWVNGFYSGLLYCAVTVFVGLWGIPFLQEAHHLSLLNAVLACDVLFLGVAIGAPIWCAVDNILQDRRPMLVICALLAAVLMVILIHSPMLSMTVVVMLMFLLGIVCGTFSISYVVAKEIAPASAHSTSMGFVNMLSVGCTPILQPIIGLMLLLMTSSAGGKNLHYSMHHYQTALMIMPLGFLLAAWLARYIPKKKHI